MSDHEAYKQLLAFLDKNKARYRLIDHQPEGRTEIVSPMRGNKLSQAAKCIVMIVKLGKKDKKFVLGVVPGDAKLDLNAVKDLFGGTYVSFATPEIAEKLAGSVSGTILPFSFNPELVLVVDPSLLENEELFFNAARLDRSMALRTSDYQRIAKPRLENIALKENQDVVASKPSIKEHAVAGRTKGKPASSRQELVVTLPDGSFKEVDAGATCLDVAKLIGARLAQAAVAAKLDGELVDLSHKIEKDASIKIITFSDPEGKQVFWHSANHVLAQAVLELFPGTALGIGPAIEEGFYYDFDKPEPFTEADLVLIEKKMAEIVKADYTCKRIEASLAEARKALEKDKVKNKYRLEIIGELPETKVSFYEQGPFIDLCRGPHVPSTGRITAFKLVKIASAYWKGDQKNKQLHRIYGIAFPSRKELDAHFTLLEEAEKRDHRKLGTQLDLFSTQELAGAGLIFWHPKGATLRKTIMDFEYKEQLKRGYLPVDTPHVYKVDLWKTSGHYDNYRENMYFTKIDEMDYGIKPMNCPGHILIYKTQVRSYRDLPLRLFEFGTVYRHELSGVLSGLFRVRGFTQDDSHIFIAPEQLHSEVRSVMDFLLFIIQSFGFKDISIKLSTKPVKAIGDEKRWQQATAALESVLKEMKLPYEFDQGGGAFYGPKIDVKIKDAIGRMWQCSTLQVDFNLPERFDVTYVGEDGQKHRCVMLHRAIFGSVERLLGVLLEHYAGALPLWLSPVQIEILPVTDGHNSFAKNLADKFERAGLRVHVDVSQNKTGFKIREAQLQKIPLMLVVGDKEKESNKLAVRQRDGTIENDVPIEEFLSKTLKLVEEKK